MDKDIILDRQDLEDCTQITLVVSLEEADLINQIGKCTYCDHLGMFHKNFSVAEDRNTSSYSYICKICDNNCFEAWGELMNTYADEETLWYAQGGYYPDRE